MLGRVHRFGVLRRLRPHVGSPRRNSSLSVCPELALGTVGLVDGLGDLPDAANLHGLRKQAGQYEALHRIQHRLPSDFVGSRHLGKPMRNLSQHFDSPATPRWRDSALPAAGGTAIMQPTSQVLRAFKAYNAARDLRRGLTTEYSRPISTKSSQVIEQTAKNELAAAN